MVPLYGNHQTNPEGEDVNRVLLGFIAVAAVLAFAAGGTLAYFSDIESSTDNTFTAGTLDLYLNNGHQVGDSVEMTWLRDDMKPGECSGVQGAGWEIITLRNRGGIVGDHVELLFENECTDPAWLAGDNEESDTLDGATGMDAYMRITTLTYSSIDLLTEDGPDPMFVATAGEGGPQVFDLNGNGFVDLQDLAAQSGEGSPVDDLPTPGPGQTSAMDFEMHCCFDASAGNEYQGDRIEMTITFTLNQDSSQ